MAISFIFSSKQFEIKNGRGKQQNTRTIIDELTGKFSTDEVESQIKFASNLVDFILENNPEYYVGKDILYSIFNRGELPHNENNNEIEIVNGDDKWIVRYWSFPLIHNNIQVPYDKYPHYRIVRMEREQLLEVFTKYVTHFEQSELLILFNKIAEMTNEELVELLWPKIEAETKYLREEFYAQQFPQMINIRDVKDANIWSIDMGKNMWFYFNPEDGCTIEEFIRNAAKFE